MEIEAKPKRNSVGKTTTQHNQNDSKPKKAKTQTPTQKSEILDEEPKQEQTEEKKIQKTFRDIYMEEATEIFGEELDQLRRVNNNSIRLIIYRRKVEILIQNKSSI